MQGKIYKTIILGADPSGLALAEQLSQVEHSTALVCSNLVYQTKQTLTGIDIFLQTGIYLEFSHGLFILTLADRTRVCGRSIVLATGTKPIKTNLKNQHIAYKPEDIKGKHKTLPAVVYGEDDFAVSSALNLAKRFRYVYLCSDSFTLRCSKKLLKKLDNTKNVVYLPNSGILSCKNDKEGNLVEVNLHTYNSIKTSILLVSKGRLPDYPTVFKRYIEADEQTLFLIVDPNYESTKVPNVYAIGGLVEKTTKKDITMLAQRLVEKYKEA